MTTNRRQALHYSAVMMAGAAGAAFGGEPSARRNVGLAADGGPARPSESGVGALMAWADRLWAVTYPSEPGHGSGTGLYEIGHDFQAVLRHESNGVYANRMHHAPSNQIIIGPYMIDLRGGVRVIGDLADERLTAAMPHLTDPDTKMYILTMEGLFYELDVHSLKAERLYDLVEELGIGGDPHFKGAFTAQGRVAVANNTYTGPGDTDGRLAEWDGETWTVLERKPFMEVASRDGFGNVLFATGWDERSAILKMLADGEWKTYRLPKAAHTFDHYYTTEWTRIREVETQRYLMDLHGMMYELAPFAQHDSMWGIRPICAHLRVIPDFCSFRGYLALGGNEGAASGGNFFSPQPQSGIWFGHTDDLWNFGKPKGWGGVWRNSGVNAGEPSDPFLMTGFDKKGLHLEVLSRGETTIDVQVDFLGYGEWKTYQRLTLIPGQYRFFEFPASFGAHWARLVSDRACTATAEFVYS